MVVPDQPVTLTPDQVQELNQKLSTFRHNVNNHLSLIIAAVELIRRKPEVSARMVDTIGDQPERIINEIKSFTSELEQALGIQRS